MITVIVLVLAAVGALVLLCATLVGLAALGQRWLLRRHGGRRGA